MNHTPERNHPPRIIGLYSPSPGCGKTTVANQLATFGYDRLSFAQPLRNMVVELLISLAIPRERALRFVSTDKSQVIPEIGDNARHLLRTLGTEWGRELVHPHLWLYCWENSAYRILDRGGALVTDDVRFPNEAQIILDRGGELWRIERRDAEPPSTHASDGGLNSFNGFTRLIHNDGTIEDLQKQVAALIGVAEVTTEVSA